MKQSDQSKLFGDTNRRQMLQSLGGGLGAVALSQNLLAEQRPQPGFAPRANRIIQLFMNGGPFQGDLFDPKPALNKHAGQRPSSVELRTENRTGGLMPVPFKFSRAGDSGLPISELLPNLATQMDQICVLRSLYTDNPNHGPALLLMNNGTILPTRPSMGSWLSYGLGSENENLPGYVVLCPGRPVRFSILWTSAFLPGEHQGLYVNHSDPAPEKMLPYLRNTWLTASEQQEQLELLNALNRLGLENNPNRLQLEARIKAMEVAFRMQTEASEAFDLDLEPESVRAEYGDGHFAHGCLLARRLAERGVRFTQVYYGNGQPWDTHRDHNATTRKLSKDIDQPIAALLRDLKRTGLLDDTLVIWGGEFGRTPTSESGDGRDHNHYGFTMWMAGGGVRGGHSYGSTDEFGFQAVHDKVHIHDLHATILHLLGIDHEELTYHYAARDFRLTDVSGKVIHQIIS